MDNATVKSIIISYYQIPTPAGVWWTPEQISFMTGEDVRIIKAVFGWCDSVRNEDNHLTNTQIADKYDATFENAIWTSFGAVLERRSSVPAPAPGAVTLDTLNEKLERIISKIGA